jgi:hypothetical protein
MKEVRKISIDKERDGGVEKRGLKAKENNLILKATFWRVASQTICLSI